MLAALGRAGVAQPPASRASGRAPRLRRCTCTGRDRHYLVRDGKVADHRRDHRPRRRRPRVVARPAAADRAQGRLRAERRAWPRIGADHLPALLSALPAPGRPERHAARGARRAARRLRLSVRRVPPAQAVPAPRRRHAPVPRPRVAVGGGGRARRRAARRGTAGAGGHRFGGRVAKRWRGGSARRGLPHAVLNARQRPATKPHRGAGRRSAAPSPSRPTWPAAAPTSRSADGVAALGGLHVICCQLNAARRIDRQLAGRAARQGDPGSVETWLSLDTPLLARRSAAPRARRCCAAAAAALPPWAVRGARGLPQRHEERRQREQRKRLIEHDQRMERQLAFGGPHE